MRSRAQIKSHPIHPMLVVMPIGLLIGSWIFDLIGKMTNDELLWAASYYCAIAGIVAGFCAAIPGLIDWFSVVPPKSSAKNRGLLHGGLNVLVLVAFIIVAVHRSNATAEPGGFELGLMTTSIIILGISGGLGGRSRIATRLASIIAMPMPVNLKNVNWIAGSGRHATRAN